MDINQLKYFEVIAQYQNMSQAQEVLHIAQPALSAGLSRLEKQLGVQLFDRCKGRLQLNPYGKIFLKYASNINAEYDKALKEIEAAKKATENVVNIAVLDYGFSMSIIPDFSLIYPDIAVNPRNIPRDPEMDIQLDEYDVIITPLPETFEDMEYIPLIENELVLAVPPTHRLYENTVARLTDLDGEKLYSVGFRSHFIHFVKGLLAEASVTPDSINFCMGSDISLMLKNHNAVSVMLPGVYRKLENNSDLHFLHFDPPIFRKTGLAYTTTRKRSPAAKKFCDFASGYWKSRRMDTSQNRQYI